MVFFAVRAGSSFTVVGVKCVDSAGELFRSVSPLLCFLLSNSQFSISTRTKTTAHRSWIMTEHKDHSSLYIGVAEVTGVEM